VIRKTPASTFPVGSDDECLIAEVEMTEEPELGMRQDATASMRSAG
jgi:hypothetical protein